MVFQERYISAKQALSTSNFFKALNPAGAIPKGAVGPLLFSLLFWVVIFKSQAFSTPIFFKALNLAIFSNSGFHSFMFFSQMLVQRCDC
jgi:hypothetical protein